MLWHGKGNFHLDSLRQVYKVVVAWGFPKGRKYSPLLVQGDNKARRHEDPGNLAALVALKNGTFPSLLLVQGSNKAARLPDKE